MLRHRSKLADDFFRLGKSAGLVLAEDLLTVDDDIEDAPGSFDQSGLDACFLFDLVRQTGGTRAVVSLATVGDRDGHVRHVLLFSAAMPDGTPGAGLAAGN